MEIKEKNLGLYLRDSFVVIKPAPIMKVNTILQAL